MNSTTSLERINSNDPIEAILEAREQIGRTDEPLPRLNQDAPLHPPEQKRPGLPGRRPRRGTPVRGVIGLLLAACIYVAALTWYSYDAARLFIAPWVPTGVSVSSLWRVDQEPSAEPGPDTVGAIADAALAQPAPLAQTPSEGVPPKAAPISPDLARSLETIVRDIANLEQSIGQLKKNQEKMALDNAKAIEQLKASQEQVARDNMNAAERIKASQEQITRDNAKVGEQLKISQEQHGRAVAKASGQNTRPRPLSPLPRPAATVTRRLAPTAPSQATAQPPKATQR
jgi:hypothetical protein